MMESVVAFNKEKEKSEKITISLDIENLQTGNLSLVNFADVVILSKDFAKHLGYQNKITAVNSFRQLTRSRFVFASRLASRAIQSCEIVFCSNIIICPWGTDGVAALDCDNNLLTADAYPPETVVDSLGAGDTFAAGVIFALYQDCSVQFAIDFASRLAGLKVGHFGYDQIREHFKNMF